MDSKYIEQLLERYWQCETSLEDEAELRAFFSGSDVPKHLLRYKDLFVYQQLQQEVHLGEDFDARGSGPFYGECDATFIFLGCRGGGRSRYYR